MSELEGAAPPRGRASDLYVVIAAYNEEAVIGQTVRELLASFPNVIVVDDGSQDSTFERAREAGARALRHPINLGQGAALQTGITYALRLDAKYIATFDADGQHDPADLRVMLGALRSNDVDVVLGSRFLGSASGMPLGRRAFIKAAVVFTNLTNGVKLTDTHNGLRVMTAEAAGRLTITQDGMAHASELLGQINRFKMKHVEVPVHIRYTAYSLGKGQSLTGALRIVTDLFSSFVNKW